MKILYIIPKLNVSGGVAKIISTKANFLSKNYNHEVAIVTQNKGNYPLFFDLEKNIKLYDIILKGNIVHFLKTYKEQLNEKINSFNPDVIIIADNGLKALFFNYFFKLRIPVIIEIHCSKYVTENSNKSIGSKIKHYFTVRLRSFGIKSFSNILVLSKESKEEWNLKTAKIIPNPVAQNQTIADLTQKNIICVTRNSYEKGIDRIIPIASALQNKFPYWTLNVFCQEHGYFDLEKAISKNQLTNITLHNPTKEIDKAYIQNSILIAVSRFEVFPLVLLEAMSFGLPIVAYNCPIGNKSILNENFGFLVQDGNVNEFVTKVEELILNEDRRLQMGKQAQLESLKFNTKTILNQYNEYIIAVVSTNKSNTTYKNQTNK